GLPVNAIYGFLTMTIKLMREIRPDYIAFCFDRPEPSFRKEMDVRYKANRTEMPEDLEPQMPWFRKLSEALGVKCYDKLGFEADDLIGTLANRGLKEGLDVVIVSGDKDFAQMIQPGVTLYDTMKDVRYDSAAALEKWGVPPEKMIDYLALVGDSSDNIAGVAGIGPKGAQKLLSQFSSIEDIYANLATVVPEGTRKKLEVSRDEAILSKKLVTIVQDVAIPFALDELKLKPIERDQVLPMFEELGFKSLAKQLFGNTEAGTSSADVSTASAASIPVASSNVATTNVATTGSPLQPGPYWTESRLEISDLKLKLQERNQASEGQKEVWIVHSERGVIVGFDGCAYQLAGNPDDLADALAGQALSGHDLKDIAHRYRLRDFTVAWDSRLGAYVEHAGAIETVHELFTKYIGLSLPELASSSQWLAWSFALKRAIESKLSTY
ncbi:MAG: 5'-3' exonuclease H3TH domain-containing protein, partial [Bdellovibrionales bacterium]|nr:5'-3' exonuclease H3TH domain-containing protein [Bdellovibrionales bacterium]